MNKLQLTLCLTVASVCAGAQTVGTWTPLARQAPTNIGPCLLLSDGTVMAFQEYGANCYRLTPDSTGSYVNGTWTQLASMHDTRLYFFSQVLRDGRVLVGGGEYGSGGTRSEIYQPLDNAWTPIPSPGFDWVDSCSEVLANGNVITSPVSDEPQDYVFNLITNRWSLGPPNVSGQDEAAWVKLADGSILTIDPFGTNSERLIPSLNAWVPDSTVPVELYDDLGELGAAFLLPNGQTIFFGATPYTAIYSPSGTASPGVWVQGPNMPDDLGQVDAPAAMMPNGKILLSVGNLDTYSGPSWFYEYDYTTGTFTQTGNPGGGLSFPPTTYVQTFLDLPDGTILATNASSQLYVYTPAGPQLALGKPTIKAIAEICPGQYSVNGTLFNGISEGAAYGDDWQMNTNYPIARITAPNGTVFYGRTIDWSASGVQLWGQTVSTVMDIPTTLQPGNYKLQIVANGIASDPVTFTIRSARVLPPKPK